MDDKNSVSSTEFLRPRLVGVRFEGHAIPLEVLRDLAVLEPMIMEVAKWKFLQDHPDRKRSPKGFTDGVTLKLAAVEEGSAVPVINLDIQTPVQLSLDNRSYFEDARDAIIDTIAAAEREEPIDHLLPEGVLAYFDKMGRRIREGEAIEFSKSREGAIATLNKRTRRRLVLASASVDELSDEISIRGTVPAVDQENHTFRLLLADGHKVRGPLLNPHRDLILKTSLNFDQGLRLQVNGIGSYSRGGSLKEIQSIDYVTALDPRDIDARIDELRVLRPGWLNGVGDPLSQTNLDWLGEKFRRNYPEDALVPFLYPTISGDVRAEWSIGPREVSLEVNLSSRTALWHFLNVDTDEEDSAEIDLSIDDGWADLAGRVSDLEQNES